MTFFKKDFLSTSTRTDGTLEIIMIRHSLKQSGPALSSRSFGRSTIIHSLCSHFSTLVYKYLHPVPSMLSPQARSFPNRSNLNIHFNTTMSYSRILCVKTMRMLHFPIQSIQVSVDLFQIVTHQKQIPRTQNDAQ